MAEEMVKRELTHEQDWVLRHLDFAQKTPFGKVTINIANKKVVTVDVNLKSNLIKKEPSVDVYYKPEEKRLRETN